MKNKIRPGWVFALLAAALFLQFFAGQAAAQTCTDSDGGLVYTTKGAVTYLSTVYTDHCTSGEVLHEYRCFAGAQEVSYDCDASGMYICGDGACRSCYDSDGGQNYAVYGTTKSIGSPVESPDSCTSATQMREYYCSGSSKMNLLHSCNAGETCTSGECKPCIPKTCGQLGKECGSGWSDGCFSTLDCGTCPDGQDCNATGQCCVDETDADFCARLGKSCESVTANDKCGVSRTVDCGTCPGAQACNPGGQCCFNYRTKMSTGAGQCHDSDITVLNGTLINGLTEHELYCQVGGGGTCDVYAYKCYASAFQNYTGYVFSRIMDNGGCLITGSILGGMRDMSFRCRLDEGARYVTMQWCTNAGCVGRQCGSDGLGGSCGSCREWQACTIDGKCIETGFLLGGAYSGRDDMSSYDNPVTSGFSCPASYQASQVYGQKGEFTGVDLCAYNYIRDSSVTLCTGNKSATPSLQLAAAFGGGYSDTYFNPLSGASGCPGDYEPVKFLGSRSDSSYCGAGGGPTCSSGIACKYARDVNAYLCYNYTAPEGKYLFGGMYGGAGKNDASWYNNPINNSNRCPDGYYAKLIAKNDDKDNSLYYCYAEIQPCNCSGRYCGTDGCGGKCGRCPTGQLCNVTGGCVCLDPPCPCSNECTPSGLKQCTISSEKRTCGDYDADACLEWRYENCTLPSNTCQNGNCICVESAWYWKNGLGPGEVCVGSNAVKTSNCGVIVQVPGTMDCQPPVVTMTEPSERYTNIKSFMVSWSGTGNLDCYKVQYKENLNMWADWNTCTEQNLSDFGPALPIPVVDGSTYFFMAMANQSVTGVYGGWSDVRWITVDGEKPETWISVRDQSGNVIDPERVLTSGITLASITASAMDAITGVEKLTLKIWKFTSGTEVYDELVCGPSGPGIQLDCEKNVTLQNGTAFMYEAEAIDYAGNYNSTKIRWLTTYPLANFVEDSFEIAIGSDGLVNVWLRNMKHARDNITVELQGYPFAGFEGAEFSGGERTHVFEMNPFESKKVKIKIYGNRVGEEKKLMIKASSMLDTRGNPCSGPGGCMVDSDEIELKTEYPAEFPESGTILIVAAALAAVAVFIFIRLRRQ